MIDAPTAKHLFQRGFTVRTVHTGQTIGQLMGAAINPR